MVVAWHGRGMTHVDQTRPHCVNQMVNTHSKPLAARHGKGTAWERHGKGKIYVNKLLSCSNLVYSLTAIGPTVIVEFLSSRSQGGGE
jgi:hypothetical protein